MAAAGRTIILPKQAIPCGLITSAFLSECKHASCLKPASDCLRTPHCAKKHASRPLLQCWPKSCTGSPRQKVGRQQQDGSCAWSSICQSTMRLPHSRSTVCTPLGEAEDALACHRSCGWKPVFKRWPAYLHLRAAILRWRAISVGFGDRQLCLDRSRRWSDGVARYPRCRKRLVRDATNIGPQSRHFATGPYPADVFDGVSRKRDKAVPAQSARHDPARSKPLSRAEGDLGIDRQRELIGALPRTRFPAPPMPPASRLTVACSL